MPKFRIVSEYDPSAEHRQPRSASLTAGNRRMVTISESGSLVEAVCDARDTLPHLACRIVYAEELCPSAAPFTDEEASRALSSELGDMDPGEYEGQTEPLYDSPEFGDIVDEVANGLRDTGMVPGLSVSILQDDSYAMVEVYDEARGLYLSRGTEFKRLTDDRRAAGWAGVLAIARELASIADGMR